MLWPVILLTTFNATIFHEMASGAVLQFDVINSGNAAAGTTHGRIIIAFVFRVLYLLHSSQNE